MAGGDELTLFAEERRVVDGEEHRHGRLVDSDRRQWFRILGIANGVTDFEFLQSDDCTDIATIHLFGTHMTHTVEGVQFLDFGLLHRAVAMGNSNLLSVLHRAAMHTTHSNTPCIARIVKRRNQHLGGTLQLLGSRYHLYYFIQQIGYVISWLLPVFTHPSVFGRTIDHREVELILCSIKGKHEVEHHFIHLLRATVRLIYLINHHNGLQTNLQGLLQHEARLRHRTLKGIHQQQTAVCHVEHALHLASEVRVSRSINDVNLCTFPINAYILRKNSDATFAFQIVSIQHLT